MSGTRTCSGVPAPITERLRHTTVGRCAAIPLRSWVVSTIVRPSALRSSRRWRTSWRVRTSSPDVGSSRKITCAFVNSARARNTRCCCPPDSSRMCRPPSPSSPRRSRTCAISARSDLEIHGSRKASRPRHADALGDGDREVPVDRLHLRDEPDGEPGRTPNPCPTRPEPCRASPSAASTSRSPTGRRCRSGRRTRSSGRRRSGPARHRRS